MTQLYQIHPENPQLRLVRHAVTALEAGKIIAYPTDSAYALGCRIGDKAALERIRAIRRLDKSHNFTLVCRDLSDMGQYAKVDASVYRILKAHTPGPYTFILPASKEVPRKLQHPKRKTIGLRIPDNNIAMAILSEYNAPLMSVTLIMPGESMPLTDAEVIYETLENQIEIVIDGGFCGTEPTSVIEFVDNEPYVRREGKGDVVGIMTS
ncbi:MAG: threonylcarbamoyl-AMP synthase [Gammaproteobacteria bacterium]|nr:threonylcarbamoyl-AMP synthase [Gammaproteobacteria bacterium]